MFTFIVKPVGFSCNLRCRYCFYIDCPLMKTDERVQRMDDPTLDRLIMEGVRGNPRHAEFNWLGGEPLLAGRDFYDRVVELQERYRQPGQRISNRVQTNGTLVTPAWADFFAQHRFSVGLSIDGPPELHDLFRFDINGAGTGDRAMTALGLLRERQVSHGVICVVNSVNVGEPDHVYSYFRDHGVTMMAFNHAKGLDASGQPLVTTVAPEAYAQFMCRVFDRWMEDDNPTVVIRHFKSILHALLGGRYRMCVLSNSCHTFFGVERNGDLYPCEDHPGDGWLPLGNIRQGMEAIRQHPQYQRFQEVVAAARNSCRTCSWWSVCQGGCPRDYYFNHPQAVHKNRMCRAYRTIFTHVNNRLVAHGLVGKEP